MVIPEAIYAGGSSPSVIDSYHPCSNWSLGRECCLLHLAHLIDKENLMKDWKLPWLGGCRCGQVRIRISEPPLITGACHCTGCQRMTASAFSLSVGVPASGFEVTQGEPVIGGLHGEAQHFHCPHCKSWMFTRLPPEVGPFVNVRATMLDDHGWFVPFLETYTSEKLPWAATPATHSFEEFPPLEDYEQLMAEFAAHGVRP